MALSSRPSALVAGATSQRTTHGNHNFKDIVAIAADDVTTTTASAFKPTKQNPAVHLEILRNPNKCYSARSPAMSPALGNMSETYSLFVQRRYWALAETATDDDLIPMIFNRTVQARKIRKQEVALELSSKMEERFDKWVLQISVLGRHLQNKCKRQQFWRSWPENKILHTDEEGNKSMEWVANNNPSQFGSMLEVLMNNDGYSLSGGEDLRKRVEDLTIAERHEKAIQRRELWFESAKATNDKVAPMDDSNSEASSPTCLDTTTQPPYMGSQLASESEAVDIEMVPPKDVLRNITEDEAILELSLALVEDLSERQTVYHHAANANMAAAMHSLRPTRLHNRCTWLVSPMAMKPKNLLPPPVNEVPAIRLILENGVICELTERFQDFSHPDWEEVWQERADAQAGMEHEIGLWRQKQEVEKHRLGLYRGGDFETDRDSDDDFDEEYWYSDLDSPNNMAPSSDRSVGMTTISECSAPMMDNTTIDSTISSELEIAKAKLAQYNSVLAANVAIVKSESLEILKRTCKLTPSPKTAEQLAAERTKRHAEYVQLLEVNLVKLLFRIQDVGLVSTDMRKINFVRIHSSSETGPGEVKLVGRLADVMTTTTMGCRGKVVGEAFEILQKVEPLLQLRQKDYFRSVKELLAPITNPMDARFGIYRQEVKKATAKQERAEVKIAECVKDAIELAEKNRRALKNRTWIQSIEMSEMKRKRTEQTVS